MPHVAALHPSKRDVINDVKLFPTVYRRRYPIRCPVTTSSALEYVICNSNSCQSFLFKPCILISDI